MAAPPQIVQETNVRALDLSIAGPSFQRFPEPRDPAPSSEIVQAHPARSLPLLFFAHSSGRCCILVGRANTPMSHTHQNFFFAAVGDTHGAMHAMVRLLSAWEKRSKRSLSLVFQVGDFEPHRHEADLATMAAPAKYKQLGDFSDYASGAKVFPWPLYFIGGNHEPYGFLDARPEGFELTPNCHYLGRASAIELHGLRIVGLSGIYREDAFQQTRPPLSSIGKVSNKAFTYFTEGDIERALGFERADVLLLHDWPEAIVDPADAEDFEQQRRSMRYDKVGNEYGRLLADGLRPQLILCGHMHKSYRATIRHPTGDVTEVCCLANVQQGSSATAVFQVADGRIREVSPIGA
ncbi:metallophosphoesterase [Pendulispora albinea]|uniref:Metallophosphoesterase n=1 Tax=Pendulispora albinea TaxID=2741071 RepID=A0ABZ2MAK8_9BACT